MPTRPSGAEAALSGELAVCAKADAESGKLLRMVAAKRSVCVDFKIFTAPSIRYQTGIIIVLAQTKNHRRFMALFQFTLRNELRDLLNLVAPGEPRSSIPFVTWHSYRVVR